MARGLRTLRPSPRASGSCSRRPHARVDECPIDPSLAERLAAVDQVRLGKRRLRLGWLWVAGTDHAGRRIFHPLVTLPIRVVRSRPGRAAHILAAGDAELTELITDFAKRDVLERHVETGGGSLGTGLTVHASWLTKFPKLKAYALDLASAAGFTTNAVMSSDAKPEQLLDRHGLSLIAGCGVFAGDDAEGTARADLLRMWDDESLVTRTAFHSLYFGAELTVEPVPSDPVESAYPLTPTQRSVLLRVRTAPLSVVAGAPGTGKSHTIAAVAHDTIAHGQTVLIAAKSEATVDALVGLLERSNGPDPVVFGSNERRKLLAERLASGALQPSADDAEVESRRRAMVDAAARRDSLALRVSRRCCERTRSRSVGQEWSARARTGSRPCSRPAPISGGFAESPRRLHSARPAGTLHGCASGSGDSCAALSARPCERTRRPSSCGTSTSPRPPASSASRTPQAASRSGAVGERSPRRTAETRRHAGAALAADVGSTRRLNPSSLSAIHSLATALRAGRATRRERLVRLRMEGIANALPLWIGTLGDIDDLLPRVAGLFDLVILDEASSVDQPLASSTLLRGGRGLVVGDPRQLRHVSFVADEKVDTALAAHDVLSDPGLAARLDIRRNSAFDVAAASTPIVTLDEHFRCDPHLVDFVTRRLYEGDVHVATRSPITESHDCVELRLVDGNGDGHRSVTGEVDAVIAELRQLLDAGAASVGVVSPFRAQADAIESAVLKAFDADQLEALDLRVGTVHEFQGNERDIVIASIGIGSHKNGNSWAFVENSHLLTVMLTRARKRFVLVYSATPPERATMGAYIAQADRPPGRPKAAAPASEWTESVAPRDLQRAGLDVAVSYPTGRHVVDIAVGGCDVPVAIECTAHPDGPHAHIERHLALVRAGWKVFEAHESKWGDLQADLVVDLLGRIRDLAPATPVDGPFV